MPTLPWVASETAEHVQRDIAKPLQASAVSLLSPAVEVDIPCDPTQIDDLGHPWAFLDKAKHLVRVEAVAIVVTGDDEDPVFARVLSLIERPVGTTVRLEMLPGEPLEYIDTMRRTHLLTA